MNIYFITTIAFFICKTAQQPAGFSITTDETQTNCFNSADCANTPCMIGCASCANSTYCYNCDFGYFTYNTPNGTQECLPCPYRSDWTGITQGVEGNTEVVLSCLECYQNPHTWELTRRCQDFYHFKFGEFLKFTDSAYELYYFTYDDTQGANFPHFVLNTYIGCEQIQSSDLTATLGELGITQAEIDNRNFRRRVLQAAKPGSSSFDSLFQSDQQTTTTDTNTCVSCQSGFSMDTSTQQCVACPQGCATCEGNSCFSCVELYGLTTQLNCEPCSTITGCNECYYGDARINASSPDARYKPGSANLDFQLRCSGCSDQLQIPSLDQLSCESCELNCVQCEYVNEREYRLTLNRKMQSTNGPTSGTFIKKCLQCAVGYFENWNGYNCDQCTISNCEQCYWGTTNDYGTLSDSFNFETTQPVGWASLCISCDEGFTLSADKTSCVAHAASSNCAKWDANGGEHCVQCKEGLVLYTQNNTCENKCSDYLNDFMCQACYNFVDQGQDTFVCVKCPAGFYPSFGGCQKCSSGCSSCNEYAYNFNFTRYLVYQRPETSTFFREIYKSYFGLEPNTYCSSCDNSGLLIQKTGVCTVCGDFCKIGDCQVETINSKIFCKHCALGFGGTDEFGQVMTIQPDQLDCMVCPYGCSTCLERPPSAIKKLNPIFDNTGQYKMYSRICTKCIENPVGSQMGWVSTDAKCIECTTDIPQCRKKITRTIDFICDLNVIGDTKVGQVTTQYAFKKLFADSNTPVTWYMEDYETDPYYKLYNINMVEEFEYNINFLAEPGTNCEASSDFIIETYIPKNVFSIKRLALNINTKDAAGNIGGHIVKLILAQNFTVNYFTELSINNIDIELSVDGVADNFGIYFKNPPVPSKLTLKTAIFDGTTPGSDLIPMFVVYAEELSELYIDSVDFQNFAYNTVNTFQFDYSSGIAQEFKADIANINFIGCTFQSSNVMDFYLRNSYVVFRSMQVQDCNFTSSTIIRDQSVVSGFSPQMIIEFNGFILDNSQFEDSQVLIVENAFRISANDWEFNQLNKFTSTDSTLQLGIFVSNTLQISNIYFNPGTQLIDCTLFMTPSIVQSSLSPENMILSFENIDCTYLMCLGEYKCLFDLTTPASSQFTDRANVKIVNLTLTGTNNSTGTETVINDNSGLVMIQGMNAVIMDQIYMLDNTKIHLVTITQSAYAIITNSICGRSTTDMVYQFDFTQTSATGFTDQELDDLKLHYTCYKFDQIEDVISMENITIQNALAIGISFIYLGDTGTTQYATAYYLDNFLIDSNIIVANTKVGQYAPITFINKYKAVYFAAYNCTFQHNLLHTFSTDVVSYYDSSAIFLFDNILSEIYLEQITTINNTALINQNALNIRALKVDLIESSLSYGNFYYNGESNLYFLNYLTKDAINLQMENSGGLLKVDSENLTIQNTNFSYAVASKGGAIYFVPKGNEGIITIDKCRFEDVATTDDVVSDGRGGVLFISGGDAEHELFFSNSYVNNSFARLQGGVFFFQIGRYASIISITGSIFQNTMALDGSIMYGNFPDVTTSIITISNNEISSELSSIHEKLDLYQSNFHPSTIPLIGQASLIHISQATITLYNNYFHDIYYSRILYIQKSQLTDSYSKYDTFHYLQWPMIDISGQLNQLPYEQTSITYCTFSNANKCDWCYNLHNTNKQLEFYSDPDTSPTNIISIQNEFLTFQHSVIENIGCINCTLGSTYIYDCSFDIDNLTLQNNSAQTGGGMYMKEYVSSGRLRSLTVSQGTKNLKNSRCEQNSAVLKGGCYYFDKFLPEYPLVLENIEIHENSAGHSGGGFFSQSSTIIITGLSLEENTAQIAAGMRQVDSTITSTNMVYTGNVASVFYDDTVDFCVMGEYRDSVNLLCSTCQVGTYTVVDKSSVCLACPKHATCNGGFDISVDEYYWRKNIASDIIVYCSNEPLNCAGGTGNYLCIEGHIGALCEQCDAYGEINGISYTHSSTFECGKCADTSQYNGILMTLITVFTLLLVAFSVNSNMKASENNLCQIVIQKLGWESGKMRGADNTGIYIKIFTNYLQIIQVLETFNLSIPGVVTEVTASTGNPVKKMLFSMDCFLLEVNETSIHLTYFRLFWSLIIPFCYFIVIILGYIAIAMSRGNKPRMTIINMTSIFLFLYYQPSWTFQFVSVASCRDIAGTSYIKADVSLECGTSDYYLYFLVLVLPVLLLVVIIVPAFMLKILSKHKNHLEKTNIALAWGLLYNEYQLSAYFWEFMKIFQKTMIIIFLNFYDTYIITKGILVFFLIIWYGVMADSIKPYKRGDMNRLDAQSTYVCGASILLGLMAYQPAYSYVEILCYIIIIVINVWFIIKILNRIFEGYMAQFEDKINKFRGKIIKVVPCAKSFLKHRTVSPERINKLWREIALYVDEFVMRKKEDPKAEFYTENGFKGNKFYEQMRKEYAVVDQEKDTEALINQNEKQEQEQEGDDQIAQLEKDVDIILKKQETAKVEQDPTFSEDTNSKKGIIENQKSQRSSAFGNKILAEEKIKK